MAARRLLQTLPDPEEDWPAAGRVKWLRTAANIFDLIYKGDGGIKIKMAMAQRSPRPGETYLVCRYASTKNSSKDHVSLKSDGPMIDTVRLVRLMRPPDLA